VLTESPWVHYHAKIVGSEEELVGMLTELKNNETDS